MKALDAKIHIILEILTIMDMKSFIRLVERKQKELDGLMRRRMPVVAGRIAKDHFQDNFRRGGFVNGGLHPWPKAKRLSSGGTDAASNYGTLLSGRNYLFGSIKYVPSDYRVVISSEVPYAALHNRGGTVDVSVTDRMRRYAWARFYRASGKARKAAKGGRKGRGKAGGGTQAAFWKNFALTRKKRLHIRIPQRQFIGDSRELDEKINSRIEKEVREILKL